MRNPPSVVLFDFGASAAETVAMARTVKVMLANHPSPNLKEKWPSWMPSPETLGEGADLLEAAIQRAANRDVVMVQERDWQHAGMKKQLTRIAQFVELAVDGDRVAVKAAGLPLREQPQAVHTNDLPLAPTITVGHGEESGTVNVKTHKDPRAKSYRAQATSGDPTVEAGWWWGDDFPLVSKIIFRGLEPGQLYWFRVSVLTSAGRSPWSIPVCLRCL